jgi:threonine dehydrogenase-like Zn-dependent dehydrogenase
MRQLTYISAGKLDWWDVPAPRIQARTDALVRPIAVARCDLDALIARGLPAFPGPFAVGHEAIGTVTDAGEDAGVAPGDRVVIPFQLSCGRCDPCRRGHTNACAAYPERAAYGLAPSSGQEFGGALSELVRVPFADHMLIRFPDGLDPVAFASIADNIPDGWRAVAPHLRARPDARVLVVGGNAQSVGLYATGLAVSLGAAEVLYLDDDEGRRARAEALGAKAEPLALPRDPLEYDITVLGEGDLDKLKFAMASTSRNGVVTSVGMFFSNEVPMPLRAMYARGVAFHTGRVHARAELPHVLDHCVHGTFNPLHVVSRVATFSESAEAIFDPGPKVAFFNDLPA